MELFLLSSVHSSHGGDDTVTIGAWETTTTAHETIFSLNVASSIWDAKIYRLRCRPRRFTYEIEVQGTGSLTDVLYFGGYSSALRRWGSGFFRSGHHFRRGFNPEPISEETHEFTPDSGVHIDMTGVPLPGKGDWFFTPSPFCFAFEGAHGWVGMGVEARPGEHRWSDYSYHGHRGFHLSLAYEGHTTVDGSYTLPAIGFDFGADPWAVLKAHARTYPRRSAHRSTPRWWREPIYCGWGTQCYQAAIDRGFAPNYARQSLYETWLANLAQHGVVPGTVVIDDKWQATYGDNAADETRWPDLRGFVDRQRAAGKHVLLWLKAWDFEGVPIEECVTNAAGDPIAVDPSNPAYEQRLRASVRHMLSADGYNADGFKIDFTARIPGGPGMRTHGDVWGLELMKLWLGIVYDEAKRAKPDSLVITHTPHPYLADVLDMLRLNDTLELQRLDDPRIGSDIGGVMAQRARIAAIACPDALIDTDDWPVRDRAAWRAYTRLQPELGVPALYFVSHIDRTQEPLEAEDYALLRDTWTRYRASIDASQERS